LNPGPSACEADVIPLHHVPLLAGAQIYIAVTHAQGMRPRRVAHQKPPPQTVWRIGRRSLPRRWRQLHGTHFRAPAPNAANSVRLATAASTRGALRDPTQKSALGMLANHWPVPPLLPHRAPEAGGASLAITDGKGCSYRGLVLPQGTARESWAAQSGFERPRSRNHGLCRCLPASPTLPEHQREPCPTSVADTGTACWAYSSQGMALTLEARQGPPFIFRSAASWAGTVTHFRCLLGRVRLSRGLGIAGFTLARVAISFPRGSLSPIVQIETH
jgi:hypothetical protein